MYKENFKINSVSLGRERKHRFHKHLLVVGPGALYPRSHHLSFTVIVLGVAKCSYITHTQANVNYMFNRFDSNTLWDGFMYSGKN